MNILLLYEPVTRVDFVEKTSSQVVWSVSCGSLGVTSMTYDVASLRSVYLHQNRQTSTQTAKTKITFQSYQRGCYITWDTI
jgi:hypothetical protein